MKTIKIAFTILLVTIHIISLSTLAYLYSNEILSGAICVILGTFFLVFYLACLTFVQNTLYLLSLIYCELKDIDSIKFNESWSLH